MTSTAHGRDARPIVPAYHVQEFEDYPDYGIDRSTTTAVSRHKVGAPSDGKWRRMDGTQYKESVTYQLRSQWGTVVHVRQENLADLEVVDVPTCEKRWFVHRLLSEVVIRFATECAAHKEAEHLAACYPGEAILVGVVFSRCVAKPPEPTWTDLG